METKTCKSCHKRLPENYKYNRCEACQNRRVAKLKKAAGAAFSTVTAIAVTIYKVGKAVKKSI